MGHQQSCGLEVVNHRNGSHLYKTRACQFALYFYMNETIIVRYSNQRNKVQEIIVGTIVQVFELFLDTA